MRMKRIESVMLIICMVLTISFPVTATETNTTYYVSDENGSDSNPGTQTSPVKTLNKAIELAEANSTIYILDNILVEDATNTDAPLVINKKLTIKGSGESLPSISLRAGGIILGADVTFQDIKVGTEGFLRPGIAANGHALTLTNVQKDENLRPLQIYGGTFFDANTNKDYGADIRGSESTICITGGSYEAVYAGSSNGDVNLPVNISVTKGDSLTLGGIYAGSTSKDPSDTTTAGLIPALDASISLSGEVNVAVSDNAPVNIVSGVADSHTVNLTVSGTGWYSFAVQTLDGLTVNSGTFAPASSSSLGTTSSNRSNVTLVGSETNKATLDLSECTHSEAVMVGDFTGSANGILVLPKDAALDVEGTLSGGPTELRVAGGMPWSSADNPGYSGLMAYDTTYVNGNTDTNSDGTFVITNPYSTQTDIAFTEDSSASNGWKTISAPEFELPELIDFTPGDKTVSYKDVNTAVNGYGAVDIDVEATFSDKSVEDNIDDLSFVPLDYKITYTDGSGVATEYVQQSSTCDENGYYLCNYTASTATASSENVLMKLEPIRDTINICKGDADLPAGTYEIAVTALTSSGSVTKSCTLTVLAPVATNTQLNLVTTESTLPYGQGVNLSAVVTDGSSNVITSGAVQLYINDVAYGAPVTIENSNTSNGDSAVSVTWNNVPLNADNAVRIGDNTLKAVYQGTDSYAASVSDSVKVAVTKTDSEISYNGAELNESVEYDGENHPFTPDNSKITIKSSNDIQLVENPVLDEDYTILYTTSSEEEEGLIYHEVPILSGEYTVWLQAIGTDYWNESEKLAVGTIEIVPGHSHQWETAWSSNSSYHWHECNALDCTITENSAKAGYEAHHGGRATCTSKAICVDCGERYGTFDRNNHTGEAEFRNQKEATETEDGYTGDVYCLGCNMRIKTGTVIPATGKSQTSDDSNGNVTENIEPEVTEVLETGANIFDSDSQVMYVVTKSGMTGGTVEYKKLHNSAAKVVTIPDTVQIKGVSYKVTSIAKNAFKGNKKLTTVNIGDNVKIIGKEAFSGCKKLKTVKLGKNVTTIGDKAFYKCVKLTSITIPSKVNKIGKSAFEKCKKLKTVTIKTKKLTAKKVGAKAFKGIKSTATIKVPKKKYKAYKSVLQKKGVSKKASFKKI